MKKKLLTILPIFTILLIVGGILIPHISSAAGWLEGPINVVINNIIAIVANFFLGVAAQFVAFAGVLLSLSIWLSTHIGDFFNGIPALQEVWLIIRNISSILIIFALLYTSIETILGGGNKAKELVVKIVIVGVLINFSLFFVKVGVDASNLVSLQFYKAIAPSSATGAGFQAAFSSGGISDVLMSALKISRIYDNTPLRAADVFLGISLAAVGGIMMMVVAGLSFLGAAVMFIFRTAILVFVMAFSPIFFAAMIFPQLSDYKKKIVNMFTSQLIVMPAYLFLMYVSLKLISSPGFTSIFNQNSLNGNALNQGTFGPVFLGIVVQYTIALIFINLPLAFAISAGGIGAKWVPDAGAVAGWFGNKTKNTFGWLGQNTIGRAAKNMQSSLASSDFATKNPNLAVLVNKGLGKASSASYFGNDSYDKRFKSYVKERTDFAKNIKLNAIDKDKAEIKANEDKAAWEEETGNMEAKLALLETEYGTTTNPDRKKKLEKQIEKLENKIEERNDPKKKAAQMEKIKEEAENAIKALKTSQYASNLNESSIVDKVTGAALVTKKARAEAAGAIRKELKKGKDKKALEAIKDFMGEEK